MRKITLAVVFTFGLNFVWEVAQSFLYAPHYDGITGLIKVHLLASIIDVLMVAGIVLFGEFISNRIFSGKNKNIKSLFVIILTGFLFSVLVEKLALTNAMWKYNLRMPILPWLSVGLTPVLQMVIIPSLAWLFLCKNDESVRN